MRHLIIYVIVLLMICNVAFAQNNDIENINTNNDNENNTENTNIDIINIDDNDIEEYDTQEDALSLNDAGNTYNLKQFETDNFIVVYPAGWIDDAKKCALIAERAFVEVTAEVGYAPKGKIHMLIEPYEEITNGYAFTPYRFIKIFLNEPDNLSVIDVYLGDWLDKLITHEILHIVHMGSGNMLSPLPNFLVEGYAVYVESKLTAGGRVDSVFGDMYMRTVIMSDTFPTIDEASATASIIKRWPYGGVNYVIGGYFFKYLYEVYGKNAVQEFNRMNRSQFLMPWVEINAKKCFGGKTFNILWNDFKVWACEEFAPQIDLLDSIKTETEYEGNIGYSLSNIAASPNTDLIYYREYDPDHLPALYSYNTATNERIIINENFRGADFTLSNDGKYLLYGKKKPSTFYTSYLSDIYMFNVDTKKETRITVGEWASQPTISPDNKYIAYSKNNMGGSAIVLLNRETGGKDIIIDGGREILYRYPEYSHDGSKLCFIKQDNNSRRSIMLYDFTTKEIDEVAYLDGIMISRLKWSEDDEKLLLSTDRSGVLNTYLFNIATKKFTRVSSIDTGALNPIQKGDKIYFNYFSHEGYELRSISYEKALEYESNDKEWTYYNMITHEVETETAFESGETGLRDIDAVSEYEELLPEGIECSDEKNYSMFGGLKNLIPVIHVIPSLYSYNNGFSINLYTQFFDITQRHFFHFDLNLTIPYMEHVSFFSMLGFRMRYDFEYFANFSVSLDTMPLLYTEGTNNYMGRSYTGLLSAVLPLRGLYDDSYSIGLTFGLIHLTKPDIAEYPVTMNIDIPFRMRIGGYAPIKGFTTVSGFLLNFIPGFSVEFKTGAYQFYAVNAYEVRFPFFFPDSVWKMYLALGYADPPSLVPKFSTGNVFILRGGKTVLSGNRMLSFSSDMGFRLFRLDRGIYPIPVIFEGMYLNLTFDIASGVFSDLPYYSSTTGFFEYLGGFTELGTGLELGFEFGILNSLNLTLIAYLYIDVKRFDMSAPFQNPDTYSAGVKISMPIPFL